MRKSRPSRRKYSQQSVSDVPMATVELLLHYGFGLKRTNEDGSLDDAFLEDGEVKYRKAISQELPMPYTGSPGPSENQPQGQ